VEGAEGYRNNQVPSKRQSKVQPTIKIGDTQPMAGYIPKVAAPETRTASLHEEARLIASIEVDLLLPRKDRAKLPQLRREMLQKFREEMTLK